MTNHILRAALAASLLTSISARESVAGASGSCVPAAADVTTWPIVRSARVPGLTLRLPSSFVRDADASAPASASAATSARWTNASRGQLVITRGEAPSSALTTSAGARPAYARCEERVGSAVAVIESFDRRESASAAAGPSSFVVQARLRWPDGEELVVFGDAADRERFAELLAAVRTIRRTAA